MRPSDEQLGELARKLQRCGEEAGLAAVGIAPATPMETTRRILEERKAAGLSGGMQFTYRNPERSTDPGRLLAGAAALVVGAWPYGETPARDGPWVLEPRQARTPTAGTTGPRVRSLATPATTTTRT